MNWFAIALGCAFFTACCDPTSKPHHGGQRRMAHRNRCARNLKLGAVYPCSCPCPSGRFLGTGGPACHSASFGSTSVLPVSVIHPHGSAVFDSASAGFHARADHLQFRCHARRKDYRFWGYRICLVTVGAYILNADLIRLNLLAPIKAIFSNPGSGGCFSWQ